MSLSETAYLAAEKTADERHEYVIEQERQPRKT
ncbi:MAG: hypothetical protein RI964_942 [Pseudomonadota bacterium]|jgi:hypothetical protein